MVDAGEVDFCARQFCYLINQGSTEEEAARTLCEDSPQREKAVNLLQRVLAGDELTGTERGRFRGLVAVAKAVAQMRGAGAIAPRAFASVERRRHQLHFSVSETIEQLGSIALTALATLIVMVLVGVIVWVFVLPQFAALFADLQSELPASTRFVLDYGPALLAAAIVLTGLLLMLIVSVLRFVNERVATLRPAPGWLRRVPSMNLLLDVYREHAVCSITLAGIESGLDPDTALTIALDLMEVERQELAKLDEALTLGTLAQEATYRAQWTARKFSERLTRIRPILAAILTVIVGVVIGHFVAAMYLPIFKLGAAI